MKINLCDKRFIITLISIFILSVGALVAAQGKGEHKFKTQELIDLENYKANLEKSGQSIPEEINKKITLEEKESEKIAKEQIKREVEIQEIKKKIANAPKDEKGNAILEDEPKPQKPQPYEDVGKVYDELNARTFFPAHGDEKYEFKTTITAPYSILISGNIKKDISTGFIYIINNDPNANSGRIEHLYPNVGEIRFQKLISNDNIAIFSYGDRKEGYFDIGKNTAFFTPYNTK